MKLRVEVQRSTGKDSHRETEETMLRIVVEHSMDSAVLCCFGRIIAGKEALSLRDAVMCQVDKHSVVLDLAGVEFIDAAGLGLLVFLHTLGAAVGFDLQILNPIHRIAKLLELTRLDSVLEIPFRMRRKCSRALSLRAMMGISEESLKVQFLLKTNPFPNPKAHKLPGQSALPDSTPQGRTQSNPESKSPTTWGFLDPARRRIRDPHRMKNP